MYNYKLKASQPVSHGDLKEVRRRSRSRCENLDRGQYPFQPIKFVNLVVPSPCETQP